MISYRISNNGPLDSDPALGSVGDPVGPATLVSLLPEEPKPIPTLDARALAVLIGLFALLIGISGYRRRHHR